MIAIAAWTCPSCERAVSAPYCPACGERPHPARDLTLRGLLDQAFERSPASMDACFGACGACSRVRTS